MDVHHSRVQDGAQLLRHRSLPELRAMVRRSCEQKGLEEPRTAEKDVMVQLNKKTLRDLRQMVMGMGFQLPNKMILQDAKIAVRQLLIKSAGSDHVMDTGKFTEIVWQDPGYAQWAVAETLQKGAADWRLVQFAAWCASKWG